MSIEEQSVLADLDALLEQLQKEEKAANQADPVVVETKMKPTIKSMALKSKKRGRPKQTAQISKKPAESENKPELKIPPELRTRPPKTSTKKKSTKPAAKKDKGSTAAKPKNPASNKKKKGEKVCLTKKLGDKASVTKKEGDIANVTKKSTAKKGEEKLKDQKTVVAKKSGGVKTYRDREKKREEKDSVSTVSKPKDGKSDIKQQSKNSLSSTEVVKKQIKVVAVKKTKPAKKAQANKSGVNKKAEKKTESAKLEGPTKSGKTKPSASKKKPAKKKVDLTKSQDKMKTKQTKKKVERTKADLTKKDDKIKDKPKSKKTFKKDKKRPSGTDPPLGESPAKKKRKQKPNKKNPKIKAGVFLESDLTKASDLPIPKKTLACDMSKFERFENGMVFLCSNKTEKECLDKMIFGSPEMHFGAMQSITENTAIFLYRVERGSPVLHGVFVADGKAEMNIDKKVWNGRFPAQVRVKDFHRFPKALPGYLLKKVFKTKRLFQSSSLLSRAETLVFISEINNYSCLGQHHLPVPLHGIKSKFERPSPSPRSTVQEQLKMLNQPINPNPVRMKKWSLTQLEGDPRMVAHGFQEENQWHQRWYGGHQIPHQPFWNWRGGYGGFQGYTHGISYHRGGYRGSRWSWRGRGRGRHETFTPGAVRQEDVEKMLSVEGPQKISSRKRRKAGRKKKEGISAKPDPSPTVDAAKVPSSTVDAAKVPSSTVDTAKVKEGVKIKIDDEQKTPKASISEEPTKDLPVLSQE